ncbi:MAG: sigma-70 family RNA polymerase sigma factor [Proteobacteria bacterium]|nr:sigma-70 family RNA polymerase sigma factor [Pseudomonadota bacterium]
MPAGASVARTDQERRLVDLIGRIARHRERDAFVALFDHFAPRIKAYLVRLGSDDANAEELTQEVMLAVWRRAASFNPSLAAVSTWVFTIARNKRIDRLRRERRPEIEPDDPALVPEPETPADVALEAAQTGGRLRAAIADLPGEQQQLLLMAFFEDKSHSAIAAETRLPLGTVKSRIRLALIRLRGTLEST